MTQINIKASLDDKHENNRHEEEIRKINIQEQEMKANMEKKMIEITKKLYIKVNNNMNKQ